MNETNLKKRIYTSIILLSLVYLIFNFNMAQVYFLIIFGVLSIIEFLQIAKKIFKGTLSYIISNLFFIIYIFIFCFMFFFFSNLHSLKSILFIFLMGCIASDIGGFILGKIFKGPKLTKISPNKTYSGSFGSIILTMIVMGLLFYYFFQTLNLKMIFIAIITSIFCQIGDLIISFFKRKAKIKDTGKFLPGHGGVLDRVDGILLGIPFGLVTLMLIN